MRTMILGLVLLPLFAFAQNVDIKDVSADAEKTTIEITKGDKAAVKSDPAWEIVDGKSNVEGDPGATQRDARKIWKSACKEWKKEFRQDNKDNKIITISCGSPSCSGSAGNMTCTSKATFKVKTKVN